MLKSEYGILIAGIILVFINGILILAHWKIVYSTQFTIIETGCTMRMYDDNVDLYIHNRIHSMIENGYTYSKIIEILAQIAGKQNYLVLSRFLHDIAHIVEKHNK